MGMWLMLGALAWSIWLIPPVSADDQILEEQVEKWGHSRMTPVSPVANPCPRFKPGEVVRQPPALFSHDGLLVVRFSYQTRIDFAKRALFCFMTPSGQENPTLHVKPGDRLIITVTNNTPVQFWDI